MRFLPLAMLLLSSSVAAAEIRVGVVDNQGAPLEGVVVSLHDGEARVAGAEQRARIDQVSRSFEPRISAIQLGTVVEFPNSDDVRHHVYSFSHPNQFELRLYHGREARPVRFEHPGVVVLGCNIHDGMVGQLRVLDTPWFATTDAEGSVRIDEVPAGSYTVELWHSTMPAATQAGQIVVNDGPIERNYTLAVEPTSGGVESRPASALQSLFDD